MHLFFELGNGVSTLNTFWVLEAYINCKACLPLGFNEKNEPFLKQVSPEDDAWNDLQLPGGDDGHKYIIQSLIKKHFAKDMAIDLVRDKGRGLIILLHGAP